MPYSNGMKLCSSSYLPTTPTKCAVSPCSQYRCDGSTEFSMGCSQLQLYTSCFSTQRLPFSQHNTSQRGSNGLGSGPRYAHNKPPIFSTGYAVCLILSLKPPDAGSAGCSRHLPVQSNFQP